MNVQPALPAISAHCTRDHASQVAAAVCATLAGASQECSCHYVVYRMLPVSTFEPKQLNDWSIRGGIENYGKSHLLIPACHLWGLSAFIRVFRVLDGQNKQIKDINLGFSQFFRLKNWLIIKIIAFVHITTWYKAVNRLLIWIYVGTMTKATTTKYETS